MALPSICNLHPKNISPNCGNLLPGITAICAMLIIRSQKARFLRNRAVAFLCNVKKKIQNPLDSVVLWFCGPETENFLLGYPPQIL
jgi:hypothetical protein